MPVALPKFLKSAFAAVGIKNNIPDSSNNVTGRAGYDQGFPSINMQPIEAGGIPPAGGDMNGVLYDLSAAIQYLQSGVRFPFNQDFATAIGGYPIGAIVSSESDASSLWVNGAANNQVFPAGWTSFKYGNPTESSRGTPFVATQNEVNTGADDAKMVTPSKIKSAFGVGQTYQGLTAARNLNVIYTNTTNRPINVYVSAQATVAGTAFIVIRTGGIPSELADASVSRSPIAPGGVAVSAVIPPGHVYLVAAIDVTEINWREYR